MSTPHWATNDDRLFHELRNAIGERRAVAERMLDAAKAAFTWRSVDEELELLTLSYDSVLDDELVLVRDAAAAAPRTLLFTGDAISVDVEIGPDVVMGQLVPAQSVVAAVLTAQGRLTEVEGDDAGFFLLPRPAAGPVRLQCKTTETELITDWFVL